MMKRPQTFKIKKKTLAMVHTLTYKWRVNCLNIWMEKVVNLMPRPLHTWERAPSTEWKKRLGGLDISGKNS